MIPRVLLQTSRRQQGTLQTMSQLDREGGDMRNSWGPSLQTPSLSLGFLLTQRPGTELPKANTVGNNIKASEYRGLMWSPVAPVPHHPHGRNTSTSIAEFAFSIHTLLVMPFSTLFRAY